MCIRDRNKNNGQGEIAKILALKDHQRVYLGNKRNIVIKKYPFDMELGHKDVLGDLWFNMSEANQDNLLNILAKEHDDRKLFPRLREEVKLSDDQIWAVLGCQLPGGVSQMGLTATKRILDILREDPEISHQAVSYTHLKRSLN